MLSSIGAFVCWNWKLKIALFNTVSMIMREMQSACHYNYQFQAQHSCILLNSFPTIRCHTATSDFAPCFCTSFFLLHHFHKIDHILTLYWVPFCSCYTPLLSIRHPIDIAFLSKEMAEYWLSMNRIFVCWRWKFCTLCLQAHIPTHVQWDHCCQEFHFGN